MTTRIRRPLRRRWIGPAVLAGALALAGTAVARPHGDRCEGGPSPERFERALDGLDLDADTSEAVQRALDEGREERRALRDEIRAAHEQMRAILEADSPDREAALAQADAIGALHTAARKARLESLLAVRDLLTPDQWRRLREELREGSGWHPRGHF